MLGKLDDYLRFHQAALDLRAQRQQLLASNIANADTPNFKARDIDFKQALQGAMQQSMPAAAPAGLARTSASHLAGTGAAAQVGVKPQYRSVQQGSVDGNSVEMDSERAQFTDNALRYEAGLNLIGGQIKSLLAAIQGQ